MDSVRQYALATNNLGFFKELNDVASESITAMHNISDLQLGWDKDKNGNERKWRIPRLTIAPEVYWEAKGIPVERRDGNEVQLLGRTHDYNQIRMTAQHFNVPVPFLRDPEHLYYCDQRTDSATFDTYVPHKQGSRQQCNMRMSVACHLNDLNVTVGVILKLVKDDFPGVPTEAISRDDDDDDNNGGGSSSRKKKKHKPSPRPDGRHSTRSSSRSSTVRGAKRGLDLGGVVAR